MDSRSWLLKDQECSECGFNICVTQSITYDYWYFCTNKECKNHNGEQKFDDEECAFANQVKNVKT